MNPSYKKALSTYRREFVPEKRMQSPLEAKANDQNGYRWGSHKAPQECALIIMAILDGAHSVSTIVTHVNNMDIVIDMSSAKCLRLLKSMALTGLVVPYVEALQQNRMRWMFFLVGSELDLDPVYGHKLEHLMTIEEARDLSSSDEVVLWIPSK